MRARRGARPVAAGVWLAVVVAARGGLRGRRRWLDWDVRTALDPDAAGPAAARAVAPERRLGTVPARRCSRPRGLAVRRRWRERLPWRRCSCWSRTPAGWRGCSRWLSSTAPTGSRGCSATPTSTSDRPRRSTTCPRCCDEYVDRIPYAAQDNWPTHVAGHPPAALLFFVGLVRLGLGGDLRRGAGRHARWRASDRRGGAGHAARLGAEDAARRAAPFLVLGPAAVFMAVSADAMFAAVAAWGLAALALAPPRPDPAALVGWSVLAGLLLGYVRDAVLRPAAARRARARGAARPPGPGGRCRSRPRPRSRWCWRSRRAGSPGGRRSRCSASATGTGSPRTGRRPTGCGATSAALASAPARLLGAGTAALRAAGRDRRDRPVRAARRGRRRPRSLVADLSLHEQGRGGADLAAVRAVAAAVAPRCCPSAGGGRGWRCSWSGAARAAPALHELVMDALRRVSSRSGAVANVAAARSSGRDLGGEAELGRRARAGEATTCRTSPSR